MTNLEYIECDHCDEEFLNETGLQIHIGRMHTQPWQDEETLRSLYIEEGFGSPTIAEKFGCSPATILAWLREFDIPIDAPTNPRFTPAPNSDLDEVYGQEWTENLRKSIRKRDQYRCQGCGLSEAEHYSRNGVPLHVHHVQPAKTLTNGELRNSSENLVSLCASCHRRWEGIPVRPILEPHH